jgi:hypothetical protein
MVGELNGWVIEWLGAGIAASPVVTFRSPRIVGAKHSAENIRIHK